MSDLIAEIQRWSTKLPAWQQEAIVRLYQNGTLTTSDDDALYALLEGGHGVRDTQNTRARVFSAEMIAPVQPAGRVVQLTQLSQLKRVNALAESTALHIAAKGLTAIYGDNGTGKSGYARVLKKACRARDQDEQIWPNANREPGPTLPAQAEFTVLIDGIETILSWQDGATAHEALSSFAIFDTRCARSYIDEDGDLAYSPYGMDILRGLAAACARLRAKLDAEDAATLVNATPYLHLVSRPTHVGRLLAQLSEKTKPEVVETLSVLTAEETARHATLRKAAAEPDPKEKAQQLRLLANRLTALAGRCQNARTLLSDAAVIHLRGLIEASQKARAAATLAAERFRDQRPGTGGELWADLFRAARVFVAQSAKEPLPPLGNERQCPLCQQPIGAEAAERLKAFDEFVAAEAETAAHTKSKFARAAYEALSATPVTIQFDNALAQEVAALDPALRNMLGSIDAQLTARKAGVTDASLGRATWEQVQPLPSDPSPVLERLARHATDEAAALEKLVDPKAASQIRAELAELDDRMALAQIRQSVLDAIANSIKKEQLRACVRDVETRGITEKAKQLHLQVINDALGAQLKKEFELLQVTDLQVSFRTAGQRGKTVFGLVLEKPGEQEVSRILSEGEQRAVAIASFFADLTLSGSTAGVVFDDPVSSLDHVRRWNVVARLVEEAKNRQVIVFTHDLYFLCLLQEETKLQSVPFAIRSLHRTSDGYGVASDSVPFDGATTKERVKKLRQDVLEVKRMEKGGWYEQAKKLIRGSYVELRMTWERAIEETLLNGAVVRFRKGVETNRLSKVEITDEDVNFINRGMTRCSNFPHDGAANAHVPTPSIAELEQDLELLETWRSGLEKRYDTVRKRRGL